jgi:hypothetical protein
MQVRAENADPDLPDYYGGTGPDGRYSLLGVAPGTYRVVTQDDGQGYIQELYDDKFEWDEADLVSVEGSESVVGIDFALSRGATISGRVTDVATGLPLAGLEIGAENVDQSYVRSYDRTGADGRYLLRGISPGRYRIQANGNEEGYVRELYDNELSWREADLVRVVGTEAVGGIDFELGRGGTISGRLIDADTGLPVRDAQVEARPNNSSGADAYTNSDADGSYTLRGLAPGFYFVRVRAQDKDYVERYYDGKLRENDAALITINGTQSVEGIDFSLKKGASISGRVVDASTGLPIADMSVNAGPMAGDDLAWTDTDRDGRYILRGIPDGLIEVEVGGQGYLDVRRAVTVRDGQDVTDFDF